MASDEEDTVVEEPSNDDDATEESQVDDGSEREVDYGEDPESVEQLNEEDAFDNDDYYKNRKLLLSKQNHKQAASSDNEAEAEPSSVDSTESVSVKPSASTKQKPAPQAMKKVKQFTIS